MSPFYCFCNTCQTSLNIFVKCCQRLSHQQHCLVTLYLNKLQNTHHLIFLRFFKWYSARNKYLFWYFKFTAVKGSLNSLLLEILRSSCFHVLTHSIYGSHYPQILCRFVITQRRGMCIYTLELCGLWKFITASSYRYQENPIFVLQCSVAIYTLFLPKPTIFSLHSARCFYYLIHHVFRYVFDTVSFSLLQP